MPAASTDLFTRNLSCLQRHRPHLLPLARGGGPAPSPDPPPADQTFAPFLQSLPQDEESLVVLVGLGRGEEALALLARRDLQVRLLVLEPQAAIFQAALRHTDLSPVLTSADVQIFVGNDATDIGRIFQQEEDGLRALSLHLFCNQHLQARLPALYGTLCRQVRERLLHLKSQIDTIEQQGPLLFANTLRNCLHLCRAVHVGVLSGIARGAPAICVAAGPSLLKNIGLLQKRRRQALIVAVDSAAKVLMDHGITPHCIATIDPITASLQKLETVAASRPDIPLVWTPEAHPDTVGRFTGGPQFVMPGVNDFFRLHLAPLFADRHVFQDLESVMHAAIRVALLAGCDPIVFIGLDLALTGGKDHADGCPVRWELGHQQRIPVLAWDGGEVATIPVLFNQIRTLTALIGRHPATRFIDATEGGARIDGAEPVPLARVLAGLPPLDRDWDGRINACFRGHRPPRPQDIAHSLERLRAAVRNSRQIAQRGLGEGKEARRLWAIAKVPARRGRAMSRFRKAIIASGNAADRLRAARELTNALFPLRAREHHRLVYGRKKFLCHAPTMAPEKRLLAELSLNIDYLSSWITTAREAERLLAATLEKDWKKD